MIFKYSFIFYIVYYSKWIFFLVSGLYWDWLCLFQLKEQEGDFFQKENIFLDIQLKRKGKIYSRYIYYVMFLEEVIFYGILSVYRRIIIEVIW